MDITSLESSTLIILKAGDLLEFAEKLTTKSAPAPLPEDDEPISQPEAIKLWKTTRQRLCTLRRQGKIATMKLNGRIYYKKSAFSDAMEILNANRKSLV